MKLLQWMQPRDSHVARRTVIALVAVPVAVSIITAPITETDVGLTPLSIVFLFGAVALLGILMILGPHFHNGTRLAWTLVPVVGVVLLTAVDLQTRDSSLNAQIFFLFPAIYGASLLPRQGAIVMLVASLTGELVVVAALNPWREATVEFLYVATALATVVTILVRGGERQAVLMTELAHLAAIDSLTGLVTRRVLDQAATAAISSATNDEGTSLVLLDVDDFKAINDRYGHPGGDEILVQLAELVLRRSRDSDVICRMGGDELALLLPGCPAATAELRARAILDDIRAHHFTATSSSSRVPVTVSIGLAHAPTHATDLRSLYAVADAALYQAKDDGRDRVVTQVRHG